MQKELTEPHALHDENGHLIEPCKAKKLIQTYDRSKVKAGKLRRQPIFSWGGKLSFIQHL